MKRINGIAEEVAMIMPQIARNVAMTMTQITQMTPPQIFTIMFLQEQEKCSFSDLGRVLHVSAPTVTNHIDRLEKSGYVRRVPSEVDRRVINIELTKDGLELAAKIRKHVKRKWSSFLNKLSAGDCENYLRILKLIQKELD